MTVKLLTTTVLAFSMTACSFQKESAQSPEEKAATEVIQVIEQQKFDGQLSEENVKVELLEAEMPGIYTFVASWPKDVPGMKVSVNGSPYTIVNSSSEFKVQAAHGNKVDLHLIALNSIGGEISSLAITKTAPLDLIIQDRTVLTKDAYYNVNRTYVSDRTQIVTQGYNLTIETNKLFSKFPLERANSTFDPNLTQILTTLPGQVASDRSKINSSHILIKAKKATGILRVGMFGFNGLDGLAGANAAPNASLNGATGNPGKVLSGFEPCGDPPCRESMTLTCIQNPTSGTNGKKGFTGGRGNDGMNGGDTGTLTVFVEDSSEFRLEVTMKAGAPGKGGPGGKGSRGGQGGAPGDNPFNKCVSANAGSEGPAGDLGPAGASGAPGKVYEPITNVKNLSVVVVK